MLRDPPTRILGLSMRHRSPFTPSPRPTPRRLPALRRAAVLCAFTLVASIGGCSCGSSNGTGTCTTSAECSAGQSCVDGRCATSGDAAVPDAGGPETGAPDAGDLGPCSAAGLCQNDARCVDGRCQPWPMSGFDDTCVRSAEPGPIRPQNPVPLGRPARRRRGTRRQGDPDHAARRRPGHLPRPGHPAAPQRDLHCRPFLYGGAAARLPGRRHAACHRRRHLPRARRGDRPGRPSRLLGHARRRRLGRRRPPRHHRRALRRRTSWPSATARRRTVSRRCGAPTWRTARPTCGAARAVCGAPSPWRISMTTGGPRSSSRVPCGHPTERGWRRSRAGSATCTACRCRSRTWTWMASRTWSPAKGPGATTRRPRPSRSRATSPTRGCAGSRRSPTSATSRALPAMHPGDPRSRSSVAATSRSRASAGRRSSR